MTAQRKAEKESLNDQARDVHEEARMVLPGVQAIFGFQLIAVFNNRFEQLASVDKVFHFLALLLIAVSMGLLMAPAAYRRLCEQGVVSVYFARLGSRLIATALAPLLLSVALDVYVVARLALDAPWISALGAALAIFCLLCGLWFGFPLWRKHAARRPGSPAAAGQGSHFGTELGARASRASAKSAR
jgi:hypothetical protein